MLKKIRDKIVQAARLVFRVLKFAAFVIFGLIIVNNLLIPISKDIKIREDKKKTFQITLLSTYGPAVFPIYRTIGTNISHEADGGVCFETLDSQTTRCLKALNYDITQVPVK